MHVFKSNITMPKLKSPQNFINLSSYTIKRRTFHQIAKRFHRIMASGKTAMICIFFTYFDGLFIYLLYDNNYLKQANFSMFSIQKSPCLNFKISRNFIKQFLFFNQKAEFSSNSKTVLSNHGEW